jgi:HSP20 family protein
MNRLQRDMNHLFNQYYQTRMRSTPSYPAINIWSGDSGQFVSAEMPGVHVEEIDISVEGDTLTISGERRKDEIPENGQYHRRERNYGKFSRTIQLPHAVNSEKVEAQFKNGVLNITLPLLEAEKPRKISIKV